MYKISIWPRKIITVISECRKFNSLPHCSVWKRIKFPTFWYNCYYFTWSDTYFIQLETLLINHPSYIHSHNSWQKHIRKTALPFCSINSNNNSSKEFIHQLVTQFTPLTHNYCTNVYYVLSQLKFIKQLTKIITWKECQWENHIIFSYSIQTTRFNSYMQQNRHFTTNITSHYSIQTTRFNSYMQHNRHFASHTITSNCIIQP